MESQPVLRCEGESRTFEPCRRRVKPGQRFCRYHDPEAEAGETSQWLINDRMGWIQRRVAHELMTGLTAANTAERAAAILPEMSSRASQIALVFVLEQVEADPVLGQEGVGRGLLQELVELVRQQNRQRGAQMSGNDEGFTDRPNVPDAFKQS